MIRDRLLAIDDEPGMGLFVRKVAEGCGCEVSTATDPISFQTLYQSLAPTVVVLDLIMPDADGIELLRFLANERSTAKIVIMSGFDRKVVEAAQNGCYYP